MKKIVGAVMVGCVIAAMLPLAIASSAGPRPDNVPADAWIPLGGDAGFVITGANAAIPQNTLNAALNGYLVAHYNGKWVRLDTEGGRVVPVR